MDWKENYERKLISAEQAAALVKSGDAVVFTYGREGLAVGLALAARKEELKNVRLLVPSPGYDFGWYDPGWEDSFVLTTATITGMAQDMIDQRRCDIYPGSIMPLEDTTDIEMDLLITEVSPPDEKGFCSFGASLWNKRAQIKRAKRVVAEVNKNLIRTYGDNFIHVSEVDYFVEHLSSGAAPGGGSLVGRAIKEPEPFHKKIAEHVSQLIRDGDTLQIGVGRTTEPLVRLGLFDGKRDLGYHSEATPPGIISLVQRGVINGSRKTLNRGRVVVTSIGGSSRAEMDWVNNNPIFHLVDVEYLEDIRVIAAHDNMVALNNALSVDLSGQSSSQSLGTQWLAMAGGQIAFVFGSQLSKGGRSIIVLPSTAAGGTVSRIVPALLPGTIVTLQREAADYVVTEYGVAKLRGKTLRQRATELINIAHPDFRKDLKKKADELFWPRS